MNIIADLHIHSHLSRACSKNLTPESLYQWCQRKGISVLSTGDFTHPKWIAELKEKLTPAEEGLFTLNKNLAAKADLEIAPSCRAPMRFLLGVEISCIYKKNGRVRKTHHLVFAPSFAAAEKINARLEKIGNIRSDGRPILGLDSRNLLEIVLESSPQSCLIPAHAWTPHFAIFGSESGFDSMKECFEDLTPHIFAIETGLSSDPVMNWRLSQLDNIALISNSDAHSPEKLAREANVLDTELSYTGIFSALKRQGQGRLLKTLEFFPEEGKYHVDGHRNCKVSMEPEETLKHNGLCPVCQKPMTIGVLHRVNKLADKPKSKKPSAAADFEYIIPLKELIAQTQQVGSQSVKVDREYHRLINLFGSDLSILRELSLKSIEKENELLALAIGRMRRGDVSPIAGYDGEYGIINALKPEDFKKDAQELSLF